MADVGGTWPRIPPEIPPPRRPDEPEPDRPWPVPLVPMVPAGRERAGDVRERLLEHRTVLLFGPLDDTAATRLAAELMTLDAEGAGDIQLHIGCQDGDLLAALMVAETVDLLAAPVVATAKGVVGGVALAPFSAASRRLASPRSTFRMSEPERSATGAASELTVEAEEFVQQVARLHGWIASASGRSVESVADDLRRGRVLVAEEALTYGLVDEIAGRRER